MGRKVLVCGDTNQQFLQPNYCKQIISSLYSIYRKTLLFRCVGPGLKSAQKYPSTTINVHSQHQDLQRRIIIVHYLLTVRTIQKGEKAILGPILEARIAIQVIS